MCGNSDSDSDSTSTTNTNQEDNRVGAEGEAIAAGKGATLKAYELSDGGIVAAEGSMVDARGFTASDGGLIAADGSTINIDADSPEAFELVDKITGRAFDFVTSSRDTERTIVNDALGAVQQARQDEQTTLAGQALKWVVPAVLAVAVVQGLGK